MYIYIYTRICILLEVGGAALHPNPPCFLGRGYRPSPNPSHFYTNIKNT